jgi:cell wall-associated NlpC family hydrolase
MKLLEIAYAEVGYTENPSGSNKTKYGKWFLLDGVPWCAMFVSWCYDQAGTPLGNIGFKKGFAGCQTGFAHWSKTGEITIKPAPGDICLFDWNGDKRYDHTGIFVSDLGNGKFKSIEGNTSSTNQSNGGQVQIRERSYNNVVFVHPITK